MLTTLFVSVYIVSGLGSVFVNSFGCPFLCLVSNLRIHLVSLAKKKGKEKNRAFAYVWLEGRKILRERK